MKKRIFIFIMALGILMLSGCNFLSKEKKQASNLRDTEVYSTNLAGVGIFVDDGSESKIQTQDGGFENIDEDYIALFVNGSLVLRSSSYINLENNRVMAPIGPVAASLQIGTEWNSITRELVLYDGDRTVKVDAYAKAVLINDEPVTLTEYPIINNDRIYGNAEFFRKVLNAEVSYFDGSNEEIPHFVPRLKQVMISRYPKDESIATEEEAIEAVREALIFAYEKKYGDFKEAEKNQSTDMNADDAENLKVIIRDLKITAENDRFYIMPVVYDFWYDKYTGEIFTFYNGEIMQINLFNPNSEGALAFPG